VNFFLERGHVDITVFVPSWRKEQPRPDVPITGEGRGMHLVSGTIPAVQNYIPISSVCFLIATKWQTKRKQIMPIDSKLCMNDFQLKFT